MEQKELNYQLFGLRWRQKDDDDNKVGDDDEDDAKS